MTTGDPAGANLLALVVVARTTMRVRGIALGRFRLIDGRRSDTPAEAAEMVAAFVPGTVPILTRHRGLSVGTVDSLRADGADLHFSGTVVDYPDLVERLRRGVGISIEPCLCEPARGWRRVGEADPVPLSVSHPYFTGTVRIGTNLIGIAISDNPAARQSVMWSERESV
jgi:hypothetical protein